MAVVGAGLIGMRHVMLCRDTPSVELRAVVEPHAPTRERLARDGLPVVASLDDLPRGIAAAIVATPNDDHAATGMRLLSDGIAVLMEKPISATLADAETLADATRRTGVPLRVGHHRRHHVFVDRARRDLDRIGRFVGAQGIWALRKHDAYFDAPWRRQPGAGPLLINMSHEIDLLRYLAGEIVEVSALVSTALRGGPLEDTVALGLRFGNGGLGTFFLSDAAATPWAFEAGCGENPNIGETGEDCLRLMGTDGAISLPSGRFWRGTHWGEPAVPQPAPACPRVIPLQLQLERFAAVVQGDEDDRLPDAEDAAQTLRATLAAALSAQTGRPVRPEDVPTDYRGYSPPQDAPTVRTVDPPPRSE